MFVAIGAVYTTYFCQAWKLFSLSKVMAPSLLRHYAPFWPWRCHFTAYG